MRRIAFVVMVLGMFVLVLLMSISPKTISNFEEIEELGLNQKVKVSGKVVSDKQTYEKRIMALDNGIELTCECEGEFIGKNIEVIGVVEEFKEKKQVVVLEILNTKN